MIQSVNFMAALDAVTGDWSPKVVGRVNDQYVYVAKLHEELASHKHDDEDEFFQVVRGRLYQPTDELTVFSVDSRLVSC